MNDKYNSYFFNQFYAENGGGNYMEKEKWMGFFSSVADNIIEMFAPSTVLDAGCAAGYLVEALRKKGVEAYGFDISEYAISHAAEEIKPYLAVHSITDKLPESFPQRFDLVVTIEVMEHLFERDGEKAIKNLCSLSDTILFTSTPDDIEDRTHCNVRLPEHWCREFAKNSFYHDLLQPVDFICSWALLFRKKTAFEDVVFDYELNRRIDSIEFKKSLIKKGLAFFYFDVGDGFNDREPISVSYEEGKFCKIKTELPKGCKRVRFDPVEGSYVFMSIERSITDKGAVNFIPLNGKKAAGFLVFGNTDPQLVAEFSEECKVLEFDAFITTFNDPYVLNMFIGTIEEKDGLKVENAALGAELEKEREKKLELEKSLGEAVDENKRINKLLNDNNAKLEEAVGNNNALLNSTCWRITAPLRSFAGFIHRGSPKKKDNLTYDYEALYRELNSGNIFVKFFKRLKEFGIVTTIFLIGNKLRSRASKSTYELFVEIMEKDILKTKDLPYRPVFSFVVPVYNVQSNQLKECIESILNQTYDNFELILVDDKSTWENVPKILKKYEDNPKITVIYREENGHISECTNTGIAAAKGEYIVFTDCDDIVAPNAVYEFTKILNADRSIDFIYSDEDKLSEDGKVRSDPFFKPDWSPDTLMSIMYTSHLSTYRRSITNEIGGLLTEYNGSQDYDFTLRFTEKTDRIAHVPKILYHWRQREGSTSVSAGAKPYVKEAIRRLKTDALKRRGLDAYIEYMPELSQFKVTYLPPENAFVSIIIPSKDNYKIIERCISSLVEITAYKNYEIIVVDNGSSDENRKKYEELCDKYNALYHYKELKFNFSAMCNIGASLAKGDYLLFLNDDIEIIEKDWLSVMLGQASLEHSGAVGAKLLYPGSKIIQHDGVVNLPVGPCHVYWHKDDTINYPFCRNRLTFNYIAVTAACLCVNKDKFYEVGGFDESLAVNYNDVDLCVKLYELGYFNSLRNDAVLYHHESISRGVDTEDPEKLKRLVAERKMLYSKHEVLRVTDPFYNINLANNKTDFELAEWYWAETPALVITDADIMPYIDNDNVKIYFDRLERGDMIIYIEGWAYSATSGLNNMNRKYLILLDKNNRATLFRTRLVLRKDVACTLGRGNSFNLVGFACCIETSGLASGSYRLGILLKNMLTHKKKAAISEKIINID